MEYYQISATDEINWPECTSDTIPNQIVGMYSKSEPDYIIFLMNKEKKMKYEKTFPTQKDTGLFLSRSFSVPFSPTLYLC